MESKEIIRLFEKWGEELSASQAARISGQWAKGGEGLSKGMRVLLRMVAGVKDVLVLDALRNGRVEDVPVVETPVSKAVKARIINGVDAAVERLPGGSDFIDKETFPDAAVLYPNSDLNAFDEPEWGKLASDAPEIKDCTVRYVGDAPGVKDGWKQSGGIISACVDEVAYRVDGIGRFEVGGDWWVMESGGVLVRE